MKAPWGKMINWRLWPRRLIRHPLLPSRRRGEGGDQLLDLTGFPPPRERQNRINQRFLSTPGGILTFSEELGCRQKLSILTPCAHEGYAERAAVLLQQRHRDLRQPGPGGAAGM